jgi:tellurite methyltransferase
MSDDDRLKWNKRYLTSAHSGKGPAQVLIDNLHLLPCHGKALDLACGTGTNSIELARCGLEVYAWDISDVALNNLGQNATAAKIQIISEQRDICARPPEPDRFDVILVSHFLDRKIIPHIIDALRTDGLLYYQTWTRDKQDDAGPANQDYLLARNELLTLFKQLAIVAYREDGRVGDPARGHRNEAMLVAQKY